jgi:serine/threonine protein kinase
MKSYFNGKYIVTGHILGRGSYAKVKQVVDTTNGKFAAIKIIAMDHIKPNALYALSKERNSEMPVNCNIETEINLLSSRELRNCEHIAQLYEHYFDKVKNKWYIVMEYCGNESLEDLVQAEFHTGFPLEAVKKFCVQIAEAIVCLHDQCHIVHQDIKPSHFILGSFHGEEILKLIDFGVAVKEPTTNEKHDGSFYDLPYESVGTPMFQAPELVLLPEEYPKNENYRSNESPRYALDIWAAGITFYYIATGTYPFYAENIFELFKQIREYYHGTFHINYDLGIFHRSPELQDLIKKMLNRDSHARINASGVKDHDFVQE